MLHNAYNRNAPQKKTLHAPCSLSIYQFHMGIGMHQSHHRVQRGQIKSTRRK